MNSKLFWISLIWICILSNPYLVAQAPPWFWAKEANSSGAEQAWDVSYDTSSGNLYVCGSFGGNLSAVYGPSFSSASGPSDGFLAKYDPSGNVLWAFKIGNSNTEEIKSVATDPTGNVYITGLFNSSNCDFDPSAASFTLSPTSGSFDGFLAKYDSNGNFIWATKFGNGFNESVWRLSADANGAYLTGSYSGTVTFNSASPSNVTQSTAASQFLQEFFGAKYNALGVVQWVVSGASQGNDIGYDVVADANSVYFIGSYERDMNLYNANGTFSMQLLVANNNNASVFIAAYSQGVGALSWVTNIGSTTNGNRSTGNAITQDNTDLYISGSMEGLNNFPVSSPQFTKSSSGSRDMFLAKLSKLTGTFQWVSAQTCTGTGNEAGFETAIDASGNVIVAGYFDAAITFTAGPSFANSGNEDILISAYSPAGNLLWASKAGTTDVDIPYGLATNTTGGIYVAGEHADASVFGTFTLTNAASSNIFVAKTGCETAVNNTISVSQSICTGNAPSSLSGSLPTGGTFQYTWQQSTNAVTWITATGTGTNQNYAPPPLTTTTYYRRRAIAGSGCTNASFSNTVTITVAALPSTASAGSSQTLCVSTPTATLNGNAPAVGTGTWSVLSGTATIGTPSLGTTSVTGLTTGTHVLKWSIGNGACAVSNATMSIQVDALPTTAIAGLSQTLCISTPTMALSGNAPAVGTGTWSLLSGTATIANPSQSNTAVNGFSVGTHVFRWRIGNGVCAASNATMSVQVDNVPAAPIAGANQTLCISSPSTALNGNVPSVGTGSWSVAGGSGTLVSPSLPTASVIGLGIGTTTLAWTISNGVCTPSTSLKTIQVDALPTIALAGPSQTLCISMPTTMLSGNAPAVGTGTWSLLSGTATISNPSQSNTAVNGFSVGTHVFRWRIGNGVCAASNATMSVQVDNVPATPIAGANQTLCISSPSTVLNGNVPSVGTGSWTVVGGTGILVSPSLPTANVIGLGIGTTTLAWTISNGVCTPSTSLKTIQVDALPTIALAGPSQTLCISTPTTMLSGNAPAVGTGTWSLLSGTATIASPTQSNTAVNSFSVGTHVLRWSIGNGVCAASNATMSVQIDDVPTTPIAGSDQTLCITSPSTVLNGNVPSIGTGSWSIASGSGSLVLPSLSTASIIGLNTGTITLAWTISNGVCTPSTSLKTIQVDALPTFANAGSSQTLCINAPATVLNGNAPTIGTGIWSLLSGTVSIASPTQSNTAVNGFSVGIHVLQWSIVNGVCPASSSTTSIQVDEMPSPAFGGNNQVICQAGSVFTGTVPAVGTGSWAVSATGTIATMTSPVSAVTGLAIGTNSFVWTVSNGVCPVSASTVIIVRDDLPTPSFAGSSQTLCISSPTTVLGANVPAIGTGSWTVVSGAATIASPTLATSTVSGLVVGNVVLSWNTSNGVCPVSTSTVMLQTDAIPTAPLAGPDQTVCVNSPTAQLAGNTPLAGTGSWSLVSGSVTITAPANPVTAIAIAGTGSHILAWTITNGVCAPLSNTMYIQVDAMPSQAIAGPAQTLCISTASATLSGSVPTVGSGIWSILAGTGVISAPGFAGSAVTNLGIGVNVLLWMVSNGVCPTSSATTSLQVDNLPSNPLAGNDFSICSSGASLLANVPLIGSGSWTALQGSAVVTSPGSPATGVTGLASGLNPFVWTIINGSCPPLSDTVIITRDDLPTVASAGQDMVQCTTSATLLGNQPVTGTGSWSLASGAGTITNPSGPSSSVSGLNTGINTFVWKIANGTCPPSYDTVLIRIDEAPTLANAGANLQVCSASLTLAGNLPVVGTGSWSVIIGQAILLDPLLNSSTLLLPDTGHRLLRWTIQNGTCPDSFDDMEVVRDPEPSPADAGPDQNLDKPITLLNAVKPEIGIGRWEIVQGAGIISDVFRPDASVDFISTGQNTFRWTVESGVCPASNDDVMIYLEPLKIPSGFSPNGDGINDTYVIPGIDYYDRADFSVFNRWGALVYHNATYKNEWAGNSQNNEVLADDTYYFTLKISDTMNYSGYIVIKTSK